MRLGPNNRRMKNRGNGSRRNGAQRSNGIDSNGPDVKVRGNAQQIVDKYQALAREAATSGDPVMAENFFQHAEHYLRILNANGSAQKGQANNRNGERKITQTSQQKNVEVAVDDSNVEGNEKIETTVVSDVAGPETPPELVETTVDSDDTSERLKEITKPIEVFSESSNEDKNKPAAS